MSLELEFIIVISLSILKIIQNYLKFKKKLKLNKKLFLILD
jgi:hypothetical protein